MNKKEPKKEEGIQGKLIWRSQWAWNICPSKEAILGKFVGAREEERGVHLCESQAWSDKRFLS